MGVCFCETCGIPVLQVQPRFKVKVEIADHSGIAVLTLFDRDVNKLVQKSCEDLLGLHFEGGARDGYPDLLNSLIGRRLLFKVETKLEQLCQFNSGFPVRRVCYDEVILSKFGLLGADSTPSKAVFAPPFPRVESDILEQNVSELGGKSISLGDNNTSLPSHWTAPSSWTPAKRKLDVDFVASQDGAYVSRMKSNSVVEVEDDETSTGDQLFAQVQDD